MSLNCITKETSRLDGANRRRQIICEGRITLLQRRGSGNHCCLDLILAPEGMVGQVINRDDEAGSARVRASSFLEVLFAFASDLESGNYVDTEIGLRARV